MFILLKQDNNLIMKNFNLANTIDFIFINLLLFLISFVWIKYFSNNSLFSTFLSVFFIIIFNVLKYFFKKKKNIKNITNKKLLSDIELYSLTFLSNTKKENLEFFEKVLKNNESKIIYNKNLILYKNIDKYEAICPVFSSNELQFEEVLKYLSFAKNLSTKKIFILCNQCSQKTKLFLENFKDVNVKILTKTDVFFNLLKPANIYPNIKFEIKENKKYKIKELINLSFNKSKTKKYFLTGIFIFFCSFIVKYNIYYVFMSSLLFLFSLICFLKKEEAFNINIFNIK